MLTSIHTVALFVVLDLGYLAPQTSGMGYLLVFTGIPIYAIWIIATRKRETNRAS